MADRILTVKLRRVLAAALLTLVSTAWLMVPSAQAEGLEQLDTSLKLVPEDAAFYCSILRTREQIEAIAESRAWARIKNMPWFKMGTGLYLMQAADPDSPVGQFEAAMDNPELRPWIDLLVDMGSNEMFLYGDGSIVDFTRLAQQVAGAVRYGPVVAQITGQARGVGQEKLQTMLALSALSDNIEQLEIPGVVFGFKLSDADQAAEQLAKLEAQIRGVLAGQPMLQQRFAKKTIGDHEYMTLSLDGSMIPWDEAMLDEIREEAEAFDVDVDKLVERVKEMTLVVALGVRDDYLLLSIGSSTEPLTSLGASASLAGRKEMKPLGKFAQERLTSIGYISGPMMTALATSDKDVDDLLGAIGEVLPASELPADLQERIRQDAAKLGEQLKQCIPEPGPVASIAFLTDRGAEGYQYSWGDHSVWNASKPLELLNHLDGDPLFAMASRVNFAPEDYDTLVEWLKVGYGYFQDLPLPQMSSNERQQVQQVTKKVLPLLKRLDKANREMLIPARSDGQTAFVLDAKLTSRQFHEEMPETEEPMPMFEPALVFGVADVELLRSAYREYKAVADQLVEIVQELAPGVIPEGYAIPDPEVTESEAGSIYGWKLPSELGLDEQIVPNFSLAESVGTISISRGHSERLLKSTPLSARGVLIDAERPRAMAILINWSGMVDAATPWINLAVEQALEAAADNPFIQPGPTRKQVATILDVLKVLRSITAEVYIEDDALVTHTLTEFVDLEE